MVIGCGGLDVKVGVGEDSEKEIEGQKEKKRMKKSRIQ